MVIILFLVVVVAFIVNAPATREPVPTAIVKLVLLADGLNMFIRPVTVNVFVPLIVNVPEFAVVSVLQYAAAFTVTFIPLLIVTSSEAVGTGLPPHVAVLDQFPLEVAVLVAE
jgi:hypothetical protein